MNDAQRNHLVQMLGPINEQIAKNKLEANYEKARQQLHAFIKQQRLNPGDLPSYKIQKVVVGLDCVTLITPSGRYFHVSAEPGLFAGRVDVSVSRQPDIEDAYAMGILSQEQYDEYEKTQQAYLGQRRTISARAQMVRLVREAGAANVQGYLDELKQQEGKV